MKAQEMDQLRQTLEQQAEQQRSQLLDALTDEGGIAPATLAELASCSTDALLEFALGYYSRRNNQALSQLERIAAALADIGLGLYGVCSDCEEPLTLEQLRQDPARRRCPRCEARRQGLRKGTMH